MQKFRAKSKSVPTNSSLVRCSTIPGLNKEKFLSVSGSLQNDRLTLNNPEVNPAQHTGRSIKAFVYVLNSKGEPLMPCSYAKSKRMVKHGRAKVIKRSPFTIQLNFECENQVQNVTLGIDTGYGHIGFSAVSEKKELISGTVNLDGKTKERLTARSMYRRNRRSRLWHREPRFDNRAKPKGWLPPSIERRYQTHLNLINRIGKMLPISKVIIEIAKFDIQKLENPNMQGEDYQQGDMYGYQNMRSYLMSREKGLCEHCKKDFIGKPSHIHHRKQQSDSGTDMAKNLMLIHKKCHEKIHKNPKLLKKYEKASPKGYKPSTFMSIINKKFYEDVDDLGVTYGHITFANRNRLGLEKTHYNDAFVIAGGAYQERCVPFYVNQNRRNNRSLQKNRKGFAPAIRKQRYPIQINDLVKINGQWVETKGTHCKGARIMVNKKSINIKQVESVYHAGTLNWRMAFPPMSKAHGFPCHELV